jgi:hypothetical protein
MATNPTLEKLLSFLPSMSGGSAPFLRPPVPALGVEVTPRSVNIARVRKEKGSLRLAGYSFSALAEGTVSPALLKCSLSNPAELSRSLVKGLENAGGKAGRAALVLPDIAGRVSLFTVPELPHSHHLAEEMIRFRMKRSLPIRPEDIAISFSRLSVVNPQPVPLAQEAGTSGPADGAGAPPAQRGAEGSAAPPPAGPVAGDGAGVSIFAVMGIRPIIAQYEQAFSEAGLRVGLVSLATLELANLFSRDLLEIANEAGDAALLNCEPEYSTLAIFRSGEPIFFRCKSYLEITEEEASIRLVEMRRELISSFAYYGEKLHGGSTLPVLVRGEQSGISTDLEPGEALASLLSEIGFSPVRLIDVGSRIGLPAGAPSTLGSRIAPALGVTAGRMA